MRARIEQLDARLLPLSRQTQNVEGKGACFFLSGRLMRQELDDTLPRVTSAAALDAAAAADRAATVAFARANLDTPMGDGTDLRGKIRMHADIPGADGDTDADAYLAYMAGEYGWADRVMVMLYQACFKLRLQLVSNLPDIQQVPLPGWIQPSVSDRWDVGLLGHLGDVRDGVRVDLHFVYPALIERPDPATAPSTIPSARSVDVEMRNAAPAAATSLNLPPAASPAATTAPADAAADDDGWGVRASENNVRRRADPEDCTTWEPRKPKVARKGDRRTAWDPITAQWKKPFSKGRGRPTRDTLGKVWLDWVPVGVEHGLPSEEKGGAWLPMDDPRAAPCFVNPVELKAAQERVAKEKEKAAQASSSSSATVQPKVRPCDKGGQPIFEKKDAPLSDYEEKHEDYSKQYFRFGRLLHPTVGHANQTFHGTAEQAIAAQRGSPVDAHTDEPRLSALSARRIELYEYMLEQMDACVCSNCGGRPLVDERPANVAVWRCATCAIDPDRLTSANHMHPAPRGRPLEVWRAKRAELEAWGNDLGWLPPAPPAAAHYPPVYYQATLAETLLVTRFRTVMSIRHMPLYHKKFRGHTISFMQNLAEFVARVSVPISLNTLAFFIVRVQHDQGRQHQDYRVRKAVVIELLKWLPMLLPNAYHDVDWPSRAMINDEQLDALPEDASIYDELPHSFYDDDETEGGEGGEGDSQDRRRARSSNVRASDTGPMMNEYVSGAEMDMDSSGFAGRPPSTTNSEAVRKAAEAVGGRATGAQPRFPWASASREAENEWHEGYVVRAFPLRFTVEAADLNDKVRNTGAQQFAGQFRFRSVPAHEYFKRMIWFWDSYQQCYPFANDPRFKYLSYNLSVRRRTLTKANVFTRQLPAGTTRAQVLWQLDNQNDFTISKLQARMADLKGTAQYIIAQRNRMSCWAFNGLVEKQLLPHLFLTTSEAELHNPFLHRLLDKVLPSDADIAAGRVGSCDGQVTKYWQVEPPPADELRRRKLAVRDNLHLVTDFYVREVGLLHHFVLHPLLDVESFAARHEFAQRRSMTHTHELLRLKQHNDAPPTPRADAPALDATNRPKLPTMHDCLDAVRNHQGEGARRIVAFVAWLGMSAIHPGEVGSWAEAHGGREPDASVAAVGNAALRRTFTELASSQERTEDEIALSNRVLCHACGTYCLKPVVSKRTGQPVLDNQGQPKKECRFRPDEKAEHSCACPHCSADFLSRLHYSESRCMACCDDDEGTACECGESDCGCKTIVWQLPHTFRFELRYPRNLARLQVSMRPLTQAVRRNYDVQFVLDFPAVIDYIVKYIGVCTQDSNLHPLPCALPCLPSLCRPLAQGSHVPCSQKPEGRSDTFKNLMVNVFKTSDQHSTMSHICAAAMNEVIGKRDYTDTEICHLLNELPIVEYSCCFADVFNMQVRRGLVDPPSEGATANPSDAVVLASREEWYTHRFADLEAKSSYQLLQVYEGKNYAELEGGVKLVPIYSPFCACYLPPSDVDERQSEAEIAKLLKKSEAYAEQRLVMFKPYRVRERDLKGDACSWHEALMRWLADASVSDDQFAKQAAAAVQYELDAYTLRNQLIEEMHAAQEEPETPEPSDDDDEGDDAVEDDPMLLLSRLYPEAELDLDEQEQMREAKNWSATIRSLHPLHESQLSWISEQREMLGDELSPDYTKYDAQHLAEYPEQSFAYKIISRHAVQTFGPASNQVEPLKMIIDGAGGCGKSHVLHCTVKEILRLAAASAHEGVPVRVCAPTGAAASLVFGGTLHSFIRWNPARSFVEFARGSKAESEWQAFCKGLRYLFIDERSLLSQDMKGKLISRLRQGFPARADNPADPTCGVSIILFGDDFQLPPTNGGRLYADPYVIVKKKKIFVAEREKARRLYLDSFNTVVQLVTNVRAKGASPEQAEFRAFQMDCLRPCLPTAEWHEYLQQADLNALPSAEQQAWKRKFRLCATNKERERCNAEMLSWTSRELHEPIATIHAEHPRGGHMACAGSSTQAQGLLSTLMICVGARVTFNWNGWVSRGVVNGLKGIVLEIVYAEGEAPPSLPLVVFVACTKYRGESFDETYSVAPSEREDEILGFAGYRAGQVGVVAVQPIGRTWEASRGGKQVTCERKQLPLDLAFAVSIHKGQGSTFGPDEDIEEAVLDIGDTELDLGMTYVGVSRFKVLAAMKIIYPTWERFEKIGARKPSDAKFTTMQARNAEAKRISALVLQTQEAHAELWQECLQMASARRHASTIASAIGAIASHCLLPLAIPARSPSDPPPKLPARLNAALESGLVLNAKMLTAMPDLQAWLQDLAFSVTFLPDEIASSNNLEDVYRAARDIADSLIEYVNGGQGAPPSLVHLDHQELSFSWQVRSDMDSLSLPRYLTFRAPPSLPAWLRDSRMVMRARVIDFGVGDATSHLVIWLRRVGFDLLYTKYGSRGDTPQILNSCCFVASRVMADLFLAGPDWQAVNVDHAVSEEVIYAVSRALIAHGARTQPITLPLTEAGVITTAQACMAAKLFAHLQPSMPHTRLPFDTIGDLPQHTLSYIAAEMHRIASQPTDQPIDDIPDSAPRIVFGQGNLRKTIAQKKVCHAIVVAFSITRTAADDDAPDARLEADATADEPMYESMDMVMSALTREMVHDELFSNIFAGLEDECPVEELVDALFNRYAVRYSLGEVEPILQVLEDDNFIVYREDDFGAMVIHLI